jgi:multidrug efflux pump
VLICGQEFTLMCFLAFLLLLGIVKKNAIMMVDFALTAERNGATGIVPLDVEIGEAALLALSR